jgi:FixJ family two-component response regulator
MTKSRRPPSKAVPSPRVLVVDDEPDLVELIGHALKRSVKCRVLTAGTLAEARRILQEQPVELLVADVRLPDGDGTSLLPILRRDHPEASAIVITGAPDVGGVIAALRHGVVDYLVKPFNAADLSERLRKALSRQVASAKNAHRLVKLRRAVHELNHVRKQVTRKVDLLCNDLINAYGDVSRQLDVVRTQEGYKHFLGEVGDLEQLLCHTMDYLMRQLGYSNIAVWLAGEDGAPDSFQLGAYMKYTVAGDGPLVEAMKSGLVARAIGQGFLHVGPEHAEQHLSPRELELLGGQDIMAVNCTYLGETLAAIVLFRDAAHGFSEADASTLTMISPMFAVALAGVVRTHEQSENPPAEDAPPEDEWWKNGEAPPF